MFQPIKIHIEILLVAQIKSNQQTTHYRRYQSNVIAQTPTIKLFRIWGCKTVSCYLYKVWGVDRLWDHCTVVTWRNIIILEVSISHFYLWRKGADSKWIKQHSHDVTYFVCVTASKQYIIIITCVLNLEPHSSMKHCVQSNVMCTWKSAVNCELLDQVYILPKFKLQTYLQCFLTCTLYTLFIHGYAGSNTIVFDMLDCWL